MQAAQGGLRRRLSLLDGLSPSRQGALIYIASGLVFLCGDSVVKTLVGGLPVVDVVFGRHVTFLLAITLVAGGRHPRRLFVSRHPWIQVLRGLAMFAATATFFVSLSVLPMAEVSALGSTTPLIVLALAGPTLGEKITRVAVAGGVIGFVGVLVLVGIDPTRLDPAMAMPLLSALSLAVFGLLTRYLRDDPAQVTVFWSGVVGMIAAVILFAAVPTTTSPEPWQWAAIGLVGLTSVTGHSLLVAAYHRARASDMAPLGYLSVVWSFLVGTIVFGEALAMRSVIGAAAIAAGGVITLRSGPAGEASTPALVDYGVTDGEPLPDGAADNDGSGED